MTLEKSVVARWIRVVGCRTTGESRKFSQSLARKRSRTAFPDDFSQLVRKLSDRLQDKHGKNSPEGQALRSLNEIRVLAKPAWEATHVEITLLFIREEKDELFEGRNWSELLEKCLSLVPTSGRFVEVLGEVTTMERLSAAEYMNSDPLDLEYLSVSYAPSVASQLVLEPESQFPP